MVELSHSSSKYLKGFSSTKSVESTSLSLKSVHYVHGSNRLPLSMLRVGDCVPDHILQEYFKDASSFFINEARDPFHTSPSGQTPYCRFSDALNIITKHLPVPLSTTFAKALPTFPSSRHFVILVKYLLKKVNQAIML